MAIRMLCIVFDIFRSKRFALGHPFSCCETVGSSQFSSDWGVCCIFFSTLPIRLCLHPQAVCFCRESRNGNDSFRCRRLYIFFIWAAAAPCAPVSHFLFWEWNYGSIIYRHNASNLVSLFLRSFITLAVAMVLYATCDYYVFFFPWEVSIGFAFASSAQNCIERCKHTPSTTIQHRTNIWEVPLCWHLNALAYRRGQLEW